MNYIKIALLLFIFLLVPGCEKEEPEAHTAVSPKRNQLQISRQTELTSSKTETVVINTPTALCSKCKNNISSAVLELSGVISAEVSIKKKIVKVVFDPVITAPDSIKRAISEAGYDADDVKRNKNAYQNLDECCKIESNIHS